MAWNVGTSVMVDSPPSWFHGLVGVIAEVLPLYGVTLTFSEAECAKSDPERTVHKRPVPFPLTSIVELGQPIRPRWTPEIEKVIETPELCGCQFFGPPCGACLECPHCRARVRNEHVNRHNSRHSAVAAPAESSSAGQTSLWE